jgi:hypothetical protein
MDSPCSERGGEVVVVEGDSGALLDHEHDCGVVAEDAK